MKVVVINGQIIGVELTRRNLETLLAKLDGFPANSKGQIYKDGFCVQAVENAEHYTDRPPGSVHPDTEAKLS